MATHTLKYSVTSEQLAAIRSALAGAKASLNYLVDDATAKKQGIMLAHWTEIRKEIEVAQDIVYYHSQPFFAEPTEAELESCENPEGWEAV